MLDDGQYDIIVVDAQPGGSADALRLELTILDGPHKGEMISMQAAGLDLDELEALGLPGTLVVRDGDPSLQLDR